EAEGDAAVRRSAVAEGFEQESESRLRILVADAEGAEHSRLQVGTIDADRSAAELESVEHDVVRARQHGARIALDLVEIGEGRRRERMMPREEALRLLVPFEQREIRDPEEVPPLVWDHPLLFGDAQPQRAEDVP